MQSARSRTLARTYKPAFIDIEMQNWLKVGYVLLYNHACADIALHIARDMRTELGKFTVHNVH